MFHRIPISFEVGYSLSPQTAPEEYMPAAVPGAVQLDYAKAKNLVPYWYGDNYKDYAFAEDVYWTYRASIRPEADPGYLPYLYIGGVDYRFEIRVDGTVLHRQEGMFTPVSLDLQAYVGRDCTLEVMIYPAPKDSTAQKDDFMSRQARRSCKPPVSYGWDWHPRLIPLGIYEEAYIVNKPICHMESTEFTVRLSDDRSTGMVEAAVRTSSPAGVLRLTLRDGDGCPVAGTSAPAEGETALRLSVDNPALWWCRGQGEQALYTAAVELLDEDGRTVDMVEKRVGFRRVRLVGNMPYPQEESSFPSTQSPSPATIELNGRRIFGKGSNWVPPEIFPGLMNEEVYRPLLIKAADANMNLLRCWGGGLVNKERFFELCDELGLMVWQEFPLACNSYPDDESYLAVLQQESVSIIKRLRSHPCLALWCGGNELFNGWSGMNNQSHALRLLDMNCYLYDRLTPFIMTSPLYGMGHGHYVLRNPDGTDVLKNYIHAKKVAYTEFGCPGPASPEYIRTFMTEKDFREMDSEGVWKTHHAFSAWIYEDTWLRIGDIAYYYGGDMEQEKLLTRGMELQAQGYKHIFEEARRQWPHASMALNWCYNEPWPCAANNSLLSWPAVERPAYEAVKASLRDQMLSIRIPKLGWAPGESLTVELYLLNDLPAALPGGGYELGIRQEDGTEAVLLQNHFDEGAPLSVRRLDDCTVTAAGETGCRITLFARCSQNPALNTEYLIYIV